MTCLLCDSSFLFSCVRSFVRHSRKHLVPQFTDQELPLLLFNDDQTDIDRHKEFHDELSSLTIEKCDALEQIKKLYVGMLLKFREGHLLPENSM